tara:strand:- start:903 stop:1025 length:123 start_codon:yes stop_codon:yes gene_type:complete
MKLTKQKIERAVKAPPVKDVQKPASKNWFDYFKLNYNAFD